MKTRDIAAEITRVSGSNLALAFISVRGRRRRDITTFYAFCRLIDDIVDDPARDEAAKRRELARWRRSLRVPAADEPALAGSIRQLTFDYPITAEMLEEIIAGVEMDIDVTRYLSFNQLRVYCYRVASAVGLVSIEIFGYRNARCKEYAVQLGLALQMTNIIRDVAADLKVDRVYLPAEDLARFQYSEFDLKQNIYDTRFLELMKFEARRADHFFTEASRSLPAEDRRSMIPAEIMRSVYQGLLQRMRTDNFRVFERNYRLNRLEKAGRIAAQLFKFV
jgi:Phytoene/squalene synthetase